MSIDPLSGNYFKSARWGRTPKIQQKAEQTATNAMTDNFIERLEKYAKADAKRGVYMSSGCIQMQHAQMKQYVSPDRSGPISQVSALLREAAEQQEPLLELLDQLVGNCTGKIRSDPIGQTAEIYSPDGEMIGCYNSLGSGWTTIQTKAESKFLSAAATAYAKAYKEARAEMKAQTAVPTDSAPAFDVKA